MRWLCSIGGVVVALCSAAAAGTLPLITKCPPDAVPVGQTCVDTYEASVWSVPNPTTTNKGLVKKILAGKVKATDLAAGGATQVSAESGSACSPAFPSTFPANGQWTAPLYAVSIPAVQPTACVTWFQADQACALSGKRLLTNAEWQRAAAGTPDPGPTDNGTTDCDVFSSDAVNTGSRSNCKSSWGAFDMVGNVWEWVSDWLPLSTACPTWGAGFNTDTQCLAGADTTTSGGPGALFRGGYWRSAAAAGVFAVFGRNQPSFSNTFVGFRCAR